MQETRLLLFLWILAGPLSAQEPGETYLPGSVSGPGGDVIGTHVLNLSTNRATITNAEGRFGIHARVGDTLAFTAVQFARKEMVVDAQILASGFLEVVLEEGVTELDEVVVMPYSLSGHMASDLAKFEKPLVNEHTLGLPNADVKVKTQSQRKLIEATTGAGIIALNPILNGISGRTKMLKKRVALDQRYGMSTAIREAYGDSVLIKQLAIPPGRIEEFMYFCEVDPAFMTAAEHEDPLVLWEFMRQKSLAYRKENQLD